MTFDLLVWLLCFILNAAALGMVMYGLIVISDLESDFINPHDACANVNTWVLREYATQGSMACLLLLSGNWFAGLCHAGFAGFNARTYLRGRYMLDVTEVFSAVNREKNIRFAKLVFLLLSFVLIIYRLTHSAVEYYLEPEPLKEHLMAGASYT